MADVDIDLIYQPVEVTSDVALPTGPAGGVLSGTFPNPGWAVGSQPLGWSRVALTGAYTVVAADRGKVFDITSGTFTISLAAAATLGAGFCFLVYNSGSGVGTVDPNASEQIRYPGGIGTTLAFRQGHGALIVCDGTGFEVALDVGLLLALANVFTQDQTFQGAIVARDGTPTALSVKRGATNDGIALAANVVTTVLAGTDALTVRPMTGTANPTVLNGNAVALGSLGGAPTSGLWQVSADGSTQAGNAVDSFNAPGHYRARRANGGAAAKTTLLIDDDILNLAGRGYDGAAYGGDRGAVAISTAAPWAVGDNSTYIRFSVTPIGSATLTTAGRVDHNKVFVFAGTEPSRSTFVSSTYTPRVQLIATAQDEAGIGQAYHNGTFPDRCAALDQVRSRGALGSYTIVQAGDSLGLWAGGGSDGTQYVRAGEARWVVEGTPAANSVRAYFSVRGFDGTAITEGLRVTATTKQLITNNNTAPAAGAFAGHVLFGVTNASADTAGQIGETPSSSISTATNAAATGTYLALTSLSLPAGKWLILGLADQSLNGATLTANGAVEALIGTTTASNAGTTRGTDRRESVSPATGTVSAPLSPFRVSNHNATTTFYLNVLATYTAGTPQWRGALIALRIR